LDRLATELAVVDEESGELKGTPIDGIEVEGH
jgi:hypothetical protein